MNAGERLEELKNEAVRADEAALASTPESSALVKVNANTAIAIISDQVEAISKFQSTMHEIADPAQRQGFVIQNSSSLLEELLMQWNKHDSTRNENESLRSDEKDRSSNEWDAYGVKHHQSAREHLERSTRRPVPDIIPYRAYPDSPQASLEQSRPEERRTSKPVVDPLKTRRVVSDVHWPQPRQRKPQAISPTATMRTTATAGRYSPHIQPPYNTDSAEQAPRQPTHSNTFRENSYAANYKDLYSENIPVIETRRAGHTGIDTSDESNGHGRFFVDQGREDDPNAPSRRRSKYPIVDEGGEIRRDQEIGSELKVSPGRRPKYTIVDKEEEYRRDQEREYGPKVASRRRPKFKIVEPDDKFSRGLQFRRVEVDRDDRSSGEPDIRREELDKDNY